MKCTAPMSMTYHRQIHWWLSLDESIREKILIFIDLRVADVRSMHDVLRQNMLSRSCLNMFCFLAFCLCCRVLFIFIKVDYRGFFA